MEMEEQIRDEHIEDMLVDSLKTRDKIDEDIVHNINEESETHLNESARTLL